MRKKQVLVRTYPKEYLSPTRELNEYLREGYTVAMCNKFKVNSWVEGNEYILEKEEQNQTSKGKRMDSYEELIKCAVEHLLELELKEDEGWEDEEIKKLEILKQGNFKVVFEE